MRPRFFSFAASLFILLLVSAVPPIHALADADSPLTTSAAVKQFEHYKNELHPVLWDDASSVPANSDGGAYEVTASVQGRIGWDDQDVLLLKMGTTSIDAEVPHSLDPVWMDSGMPLRLIIKVNTDTSQTAQAAYVVTAAAPASEIDTIEAASAPRAAVKSVREGTLSSRYKLASMDKGHPICALPPNVLAIYPYYRAVVSSYNPRLDSLTVDKITSSILAYSNYYHIDPRLIMAMIIAESGFNPHSTSRTGAMGLGQLMPSTAAGLGVRNPYDPIQNVGAAVKILSDHVAQYGGATADGVIPMNTLLLTMAAYNAGGGAVAKYHGVPPYRETQNYVRKVGQLYREMCGD